MCAAAERIAPSLIPAHEKNINGQLPVQQSCFVLPLRQPFGPPLRALSKLTRPHTVFLSPSEGRFHSCPRRTKVHFVHSAGREERFSVRAGLTEGPFAGVFSFVDLFTTCWCDGWRPFGDATAMIPRPGRNPRH